jgi:biopolymer transport protein ExbB
MIDVFQRGGIIMYIIAACSVIALAIFLERLWSLQRNKVVPGSFVKKVRDLVSQGKASEALVLSQNHPSSVAAVFAAGLRRADGTRADIKEGLQDVGRHEAASLERFVGVLGTVAAISPLLGLLGTVTGMIRVFQDVTTRGVGNPADLASGIWEALITTAYGLIVAIPTLVAFRYISSRADSLVLEMEEDALELVDDIEQYAKANAAKGES